MRFADAMTKTPKLDKNLARTLSARRALMRQHKTFERFCEYLFRLEDEPLPKPGRAPAPIRPRAKPFDQGEVVNRCRRARESIFRSFEEATTRPRSVPRRSRKRHTA